MSVALDEHMGIDATAGICDPPDACAVCVLWQRPGEAEAVWLARIGALLRRQEHTDRATPRPGETEIRWRRRVAEWRRRRRTKESA